MAHEKLRPQYFFDAERIEHLKQLAPECFEDGQINFETLRQNLGDWAQDDTDPELEHFGLFWPGKRDARKAAAIPHEGALQPVWGEGLKADGTPDTDGHNDSKNIFIEGENLEVLKLLQKSYANKVKMIYIDPPYNTGNDFVYDDDFTEPLNEYLRRTGQVDEEGKPMTTNKRSDGRFHSKWLSMMYPRLRLARNLLREDGVIFVSIDDNEVHNLRAIMNEIFGEENFMAQVIWIKKYAAANDAKGFASFHDYIVVFRKSSLFERALLPRTEKQDQLYKYDDNDGKGRWRTDNLTVKTYSKSYDYPITNPITQEVYNPSKGRCWLTNKDKMEEWIKEGRVFFGKDGTGAPQLKRYLNEVQQGVVPSTFWNYDECGHNDESKKEIKELFDSPPFDTPKPTRLLKRVLQISCEDNDIVLDFFAGSSTTAHAVLDFNAEKKTNIQYIMVQIPEALDTKNDALKDWNTLAEVSSQRIRNAVKKFNFDIPDKGFRYSKLNHSSFKPWHNIVTTSTAELELQFETFNQNPLREGWSKDGLLTEVMLMEGFTLCSSIATIDAITSNAVQRVTSEYCSHALLVCFDESIQPETIAALQLGVDDIFICLDSAISTQDKLRLSDKGLIKTI